MHNSVKSWVKNDESKFFNPKETFIVEHLKNECRIQWYLTITRAEHINRNCEKKNCEYCDKIIPQIAADHSDQKLGEACEGDVCVIPINGISI